ncbi:hypothetical protein [Cupriavidus basilensis]|uniref:Uncharacterized protein n=1 Tax=Cupriavidus basilensis TaxID=68895 RepID=A0A643FPZ4_9BURK|nr:hypothetical protein [Cupriavidus basilensis]QOT77196.1 hypothetical protein F7R26_003690 [Cupriavidus basilensis]
MREAAKQSHPGLAQQAATRVLPDLLDLDAQPVGLGLPELVLLQPGPDRMFPVVVAEAGAGPHLERLSARQDRLRPDPLVQHALGLGGLHFIRAQAQPAHALHSRHRDHPVVRIAVEKDALARGACRAVLVRLACRVAVARGAVHDLAVDFLVIGMLTRPVAHHVEKGRQALDPRFMLDPSAHGRQVVLGKIVDPDLLQAVGRVRQHVGIRHAQPPEIRVIGPEKCRADADHIALAVADHRDRAVLAVVPGAVQLAHARHQLGQAPGGKGLVVARRTVIDQPVAGVHIL